MRNIVIGILLLVALPLWAQTINTEDIASTDGYVLVWHDEFNNDGSPSTQNWNFEEGFVRNKELQWYQPQNALCRNGILTLTARHENRPNPNYNSKSHEWGKLRKNIYVSSASIHTRGKHEFTYGRFEIRARICGTPGSWPSIWLLGNKYPWPACGEIDVMSFHRHHGSPTILSNVCWAGNEDVSEWDMSAHSFDKYLEDDPLWSHKFHVWRLDWDHDFMRIYLDDELLNETSMTQTFNSPTSSGANDNPFESPHYILLSLAMGSSGGFYHKDTLPVNFEIDYVRVFQKL